jgi:hypothetical protein
LREKAEADEIINKLRGLLTNWFFWLLIITGIAIIIRALPGWTNAAWGCDFGIYYGQTLKLVGSWELYNPYTGWGSSYNYFPVLYAINAFAHWVTGLDVLTIMPKLTPIFGGLTVLIFYFLVYELMKNRKIALLSSLILAVLPFHVYQLSHASPLTMGHFFMVLSLWLFLKYRKDTLYGLPLIISTGLLIMSHHLTTYFFLISLIVIVFFENTAKGKWTNHVRKDVFYIFVTSIMIFAYWAFIATTVWESFMRAGFAIGGVRIESIYLVILFYAVFFGLFGLVKLLWRFNAFLNERVKTKTNIFIKILWRTNPFIKKKKSSLKSCLFKFFIALVIMYSAMIYYTRVPLPWTNFPLPQIVVVLATPLVIIFAFTVSGFRFTHHVRNGYFIRGWLIALLVSFLYGLLSNSGIILPHRHIEYLMYPVAIISVFGIGAIFYGFNFDTLFEKIVKLIRNGFSYFKGKKVFKTCQIAGIVLIVGVVATNAIIPYEIHHLLGQSHEDITVEDVSTIVLWMEDNLDKNSSVVASDHRLERIAEAVGFNTTKDEAVNIWAAENLSEYIDELMGIGRNYSRVTHVIVDDIMKDIVVHVGFKKPGIYITNETWTGGYDKFLQQPFILIYRNETEAINPVTLEPVHWTEVYEINWSYIDEYVLS